MKTKLLLFISYISFTLSYSQDKLTFTYDTAGNQILRDKICINCAPPGLSQPSQAVVLDAGLTGDGLSKKPFVVYPNPTTHLLFVEWSDAGESVVDELNLFTLDGKQLLNLKPGGNTGQTNIDFSRYPAGVYLLITHFNSGKNESFKIIKN